MDEKRDILRVLKTLDGWLKVKELRQWDGTKAGEKTTGFICELEMDKLKFVYRVQFNRHVENQDIEWIIERMRKPKGRYGLLLVAPYIRQEQAARLINAGIDYADLAGNAHLRRGRLLVHIEGKKRMTAAPRHARRAFEPAGYRLLFPLIADPDAVNWTYRKLADVADVAVGTVHAVFRNLKDDGYLAGERRHRILRRKGELAARWVEGYGNVLRPGLVLGQFRAKEMDTTAAARQLAEYLGKKKREWALTGTQAAYELTKFYRGDDLVFFVDKLPKDLARTFKYLKDPNGNITALRMFCRIKPTETGGIPIAHPLLVYAELQHIGTDRAREAAREVRAKYLVGEIDEA